MTATTSSAWPRRDANGRTNQRVRRNSREAIGAEARAFLTPRQRRQRMEAFRRHARAIRKPGERWGARWADGQLMRDQLHANPEVYSTHAADVLDFLLYFAQQHGRVFPSLKEISGHVGCAYRTAVRCVQQLLRGGWIEWERRFVAVAGSGEAGPQVVQTSNLYHLRLPNAAGKLIAAMAGRRPPGPDTADAEAARRHSAEFEAAEAEAVGEALRAAQRRNQAILTKLAAARTPGAVLQVFRDNEKIGEALAKMEQALAAKREFHGGAQARA